MMGARLLATINVECVPDRLASERPTAAIINPMPAENPNSNQESTMNTYPTTMSVDVHPVAEVTATVKHSNGHTWLNIGFDLTNNIAVHIDQDQAYSLAMQIIDSLADSESQG